MHTMTQKTPWRILIAILSGVRQAQGTINGLGEMWQCKFDVSNSFYCFKESFSKNFKIEISKENEVINRMF